MQYKKENTETIVEFNQELEKFINLKSIGPYYCSPFKHFDKYGECIKTENFGYDMKCDDHYGYIYYWSSIKGDCEYIYKVSLNRYQDLYYNFITEEGFECMKEYEAWEYKDLLGAVYREVA